MQTDSEFNSSMVTYYLHCVQKTTHPYIFLYLHEKCLDLHKIFSECLGRN